MTTVADVLISMQRRVANIERTTHAVPHGSDVYDEADLVALAGHISDEEVAEELPEPTLSTSAATPPADPGGDGGDGDD